MKTDNSFFRYMIYRLSMVFVAFCLISCESRIDLGDDGLGETLCLNAQLCTADTVHTVYLSLNRQDGFYPVTEGKITCYVNGNPAAETVTVDDIQSEQYYYYDNEPFRKERSDVRNPEGVSVFHLRTVLSPGDKVVLEAESGGLHCQTETLDVPKAVVIDNVSFTQNNSSSLYDLKLRIEDFKNEDNFFRISVYDKSYSVFDEVGPSNINALPGQLIMSVDQIIDVNSEDEPLLNNGISKTLSSSNGVMPSYFDNDYKLFKDDLFRDGDYVMNLVANTHFNTATYNTTTSGDVVTVHRIAMVRVLNLSRDEYQYLDGWQFLDSNESGYYLSGNFIFPQNVKDGLGFVAISTATDVKYELEPVRYDDSYFSSNSNILSIASLSGI